MTTINEEPMTGLLVDDMDFDLYINPDELNNELMDQPLRYAKWGKLKADANKKVKAIKHQLEITQSEVRRGIRNSNPSLKVAEIEGRIKEDEGVIRLQEELIEAEYIAERIEIATKAFYQRGDLLKELSTNRRRELID